MPYNFEAKTIEELKRGFCNIFQLNEDISIIQVRNGLCTLFYKENNALVYPNLWFYSWEDSSKDKWTVKDKCGIFKKIWKKDGSFVAEGIAA